MKNTRSRLNRIVHLIFAYIYLYRYYIAIGIFVLGILFEINGSSLGCWELLVSGGERGRVILGTSRPIRSDEWIVSSSMLASQYKADFPYFNSLYRAVPTDMFIVYGQPVKDIAVLFRPFHWGYLFLPFAKGLSFYWVGKAVALMLVSFELGMLLTEKRKNLSFLFAVMVCLAPATQWWYAVNSFPDMLIYGQLVVLLIYNYFNVKKYFVRFVIGVAFAICCGAYALVFYPAWQIPFAYAFFALAIWALYKTDRLFSWKKDIPILTVALFLLVVGLAYVAFKSFDTIQSVMNTAYPGARCEVGGGGLSYFFRYPGNLLFAVKETGGYGIVAPEWSVMLDLFPLGWILTAFVLLKERKKDLLLIMLAIVSLFFSVYVVFGVGEGMAKFSLLSNSTISRVFTAVGFINLLMLVRSMALMHQPMKVAEAAVGALILSFSIVMLSKKYVYMIYLDSVSVTILIVFFGILFYCLLCVTRKHMICVILGLIIPMSCISGGLVNPVRSGVYDTAASSLGRVVRSIDKADSGIWLDATGEGRMGDFLGAVGVSIINPTNTYPVLERWRTLDPTGEYESIYNRYAHIEVELQEDSISNFTLPVQDVVHINLNINDLKLLGVDYILTKNTFVPMDTELISFHQQYMDEDYSIFQVVMQ